MLIGDLLVGGFIAAVIFGLYLVVRDSRNRARRPLSRATRRHQRRIQRTGYAAEKALWEWTETKRRNRREAQQDWDAQFIELLPPRGPKRTPPPDLLRTPPRRTVIRNPPPDEFRSVKEEFEYYYKQWRDRNL